MDFSNEIPDALTPEIIAQLKGEAPSTDPEKDSVLVDRALVIRLIESERRYLLYLASSLKEMKDDPQYNTMSYNLLGWALDNNSLRWHVMGLPKHKE